MRRSRGTRGRRERLAAWLYTGPLGHLYAFTADLLAWAVPALMRRAGRRLRAEARRLRA